MRAGLPMITINVGGVNELIVDGEHGFLIERNEKVLLKKSLQQLLSDETLRKKWATLVNDIF
ncbi:glycosyltransferase [Lysinibacillus sp. NPDC097287]|uniref:glycosyltransferase n=1 Tax=Lysinibacillus sp. NPDC097287 TaxID=3364144 RepID=UPI0038220F45